nr:hypothetical protein [uncultured Fluviicola sp.]
MKKKPNVRFLLLIAVLAVLIIYLIYRTRGAKVSDDEIEKQIASPDAPSPAKAKTPSTSTTLGNDAVLKYGTKGREVGWIQYYYNKMIARPKGLTLLVQDNKFGPKTESAVFSVLGKKTTSWYEWKHALDAKAFAPAISSPTPLPFSVPVAESTKYVNPYTIKG